MLLLLSWVACASLRLFRSLLFRWLPYQSACRGGFWTWRVGKWTLERIVLTGSLCHPLVMIWTLLLLSVTFATFDSEMMSKGRHWLKLRFDSLVTWLVASFDLSLRRWILSQGIICLSFWCLMSFERLLILCPPRISWGRRQFWDIDSEITFAVLNVYQVVLILKSNQRLWVSSCILLMRIGCCIYWSLIWKSCSILTHHATWPFRFWHHLFLQSTTLSGGRELWSEDLDLVYSRWSTSWWQNLS